MSITKLAILSALFAVNNAMIYNIDKIAASNDTAVFSFGLFEGGCIESFDVESSSEATTFSMVRSGEDISHKQVPEFNEFVVKNNNSRRRRSVHTEHQSKKAGTSCFRPFHLSESRGFYKVFVGDGNGVENEFPVRVSGTVHIKHEHG